MILIKEKSYIARFAAFKLKNPKIAMVIGQKILLYGVSKKEFLADLKWVKHELEHIRQFKKYGFIKFIYLYLLESIKNGYYNNKFEVLARQAESSEDNNELLNQLDIKNI